MLRPLLLLFLAFAKGCIAPAVSDATTNPASPFLDASFSFASSSVPACNELDKCRSLVSIITSCLATIFACVWVAVHPNVPGPRQTWISKKIESFKLVVATLLVPEWVLAWAVRQFLQARHYAGILERARIEAADGATLEHNRDGTYEETNINASSSDHGGEQPAGIRLTELFTPGKNISTDSTGSIDNVSEVTRDEPDDERTKLTRRQSPERSTAALLLDKLVDPWEVEHDLGRTNQSWTIAHAFLIIMGGFQYYRRGEPMFPLQMDVVSGWDSKDDDLYVLALVKSRSLVPPTSDELGDRSKGDALSKSIAILQTLCTPRRKLAITNLELVTLAYTVITVAMYAVWWHKPLNVHCPIRVQRGEEFAKHPARAFQWSQITDYIIGDQDSLIILSQEERVPTFWSSSCTTFNSKLPLYADVVALIVAAVFGAIHCAAWSYAFPSYTDQSMWQICAITIVMVPLIMAVAFATENPFIGGEGGVSVSNGAVLYIPARIILLVLSFTTLRQMPLSAYQTVQWITWIPHI
ncbi:hypothetical protein FIBSPDRAFT_930558 [Athelia psychrophila]|uniref:Uncharacterized protein n=1 Tax=Athelia psychrophila TaxID=1759441 RepID=A0A166M0B4_9AGAM|nr:hypothetical protein FIBSPDRAFT_930558 [Fibularhizoctonia sp. CBS 109695]